MKIIKNIINFFSHQTIETIVIPVNFLEVRNYDQNCVKCKRKIKIWESDSPICNDRNCDIYGVLQIGYAPMLKKRQKADQK